MIIQHHLFLKYKKYKYKQSTTEHINTKTISRTRTAINHTHLIKQYKHNHKSRAALYRNTRQQVLGCVFVVGFDLFGLFLF